MSAAEVKSPEETSVQQCPDDSTATISSLAGQASSRTREAFGAGEGAVRKATQTSPRIAKSLSKAVKAGPNNISAGAISAASALHSTAQGVLASDLSTAVNALLQGAVKGPASIYDRTMDARFIETGIGGSYHRLFDGGHTVPGAFAAARGASPDDTIVQEALGAMQGLLRDASTTRGLPLATWNQDTFNQVASFLQSNFLIPKSWFTDLNTYTGTELLGGTIGAVAVVFAWNRAESEEFAKLAGALGLSAALGANPLLMVITVVAMARAFHKARRSGKYAELVDGQVKGGVIAGTSIAAVTVVGIGGGPAGLALLVAVVAGVLTNVAVRRVSVFQIGLIVRGLASEVASSRELRGRPNMIRRALSRVSFEVSWRIAGLRKPWMNFGFGN